MTKIMEVIRKEGWSQGWRVGGGKKHGSPVLVVETTIFKKDLKIFQLQVEKATISHMEWRFD